MLNSKVLRRGMLATAAKFLNVENPDKKPFARIDLKNCNVGFDYTICTWDNVQDYVEFVQQQSEDLDEETYNNFKEDGFLPEAKVSVVMMTEKEFSDWFRDNVEANA